MKSTIRALLIAVAATALSATALAQVGMVDQPDAGALRPNDVQIPPAVEDTDPELGAPEADDAGKMATLLPGLPPGDHYVCYRAQTPQMKPFWIGYADQFGPRRAQVREVTRLCNPARKWHAGKLSNISNPRLHYVCYRLQTQFQTRLVVIRNQFGIRKLKVTGPDEICVPSWKRRLR
jgi:hypothetical protein